MVKENKKHPRVAVLIVAAGRGTRMKSDMPKQYRRLGSHSVLYHTLSAFEKHPLITSLTCILHEEDHALYQHHIKNNIKNKRLKEPVIGGQTRQQSVFNGLKALEQDAPDYVLIHDGARPFITHEEITKLIKALNKAPAICAGTYCVDSLKIKGEQYLDQPINRDSIFVAHTPQGFAYKAILEAHKYAASKNIQNLSDDESVAALIGIKSLPIFTSKHNFKITTEDDLALARLYLKKESQKMQTRTGFGYDVHAFEQGSYVTLCGVQIPHNKALKGHSDADAPMHALTDALYGALGDGDIGIHFPPSDPSWRGASSDIFLKHALQLLKQRGGTLIHCDITIICEAPKIAPHQKAMKENLAKICALKHDAIGLKATTHERIGSLGREEGIAAMAVATINLPE